MVPSRRSARAAIPSSAVQHHQQLLHQQLRSPPEAQLMLKPLFFEVPTQEQEPQFNGRQWLLRDISNTLNHPESQGVLVVGGPGAGKTSLCLQLVEHSCFGRRRNCAPVDPDAIYAQINAPNDRLRALASHIVAYHFCQADNNSTCLVPDFIHSLAAQLCQAPQLSAYRDYLLGEGADVLSVRECIADPERAMKMGILEPLMQLKKTGQIASKSCVLLIDGLCEAEYHRPDQGDTIGSFLARMVTYFPAWLKIIATVRTQMIEFVKLTGLPRFSLDGHLEVVQKDVYEYCSQRIRTNATIQNNIQVPGESPFSVQAKFVQYLMNLAKGSYLFVKLSLDLIESGHLIIKSNTFKVVPVSLSQVFLLKFNLKFPTTSKFERVVNVLNICLASLYPLTQSEIFYTLNAMQTTAAAQVTWTEFVDVCNELADILVKRSDGTFMFFHPSVREWLIRRDTSESSKFLCDSRVGHAAIAYRLSRLQSPLDSAQILELGHHILKAHIYRNTNTGVLPRDAQAFWLTTVAKHIESSLCTLRNIYSPNVKVSRLLLLAGASPNYQTDILGQAPILLIAASEGITSMVNLLLEFGADIENTNSQGSTALILAAAKGHYEVVRQLVVSGASLGHTDNSNRCALVHAARAGKLNILKYLLSCDWISRVASSDIPQQEAVQQALICASAQGCCEIVEELLEMGPRAVQIDGQDSVTGETALVAAAKNGHIDIITCLLARGARVDAGNKRGVTALIAAAKEGHVAAVERLMQFRAVDLGQRDDDGRTALIYASQENHMEIINLFLVQEGMDMEVVDNEGMTALSWSCLRGHLTATTVLLDNSANIYHTDSTGRTPLDLAAYQGSAALAQLLIERGSTLEHVDLNGMRPLDRAIACRNIQIVPVFLKKGAKLGPATWEMAAGKPEIL